MSDLLGGQVQSYFASRASASEHVKAGKLRAIAVTIDKRSEVLPEIPTVGEIVPGYEASLVRIGAPKSTPTEIVESSTRRSMPALADPKMQARLAELAASRCGSPAEFGKLLADETEKWAKVIKFADRQKIRMIRCATRNGRNPVTRTTPA